MVWQQLLLGIACVSLCVPAFANSSSIESLARQTVSVGIPNRISGPIAEQIDLPADAPVHLLEIGREQATDGMNHAFHVLVELSTGTPRRPLGPIGIVLSTRRVTGGASEGRWFRAGLNGALERVMRIQGQAGIKGSGTVTKEGVESPEVKESFQHELDLWLKRKHLKKEWRAAEFSGGVLKKKGKRR